MTPQTKKEETEDFFKITIEQGILNSLLDNGKITIDEKYYHERSIKLMKDAQEFGFQQGKLQAEKEFAEWLRGFWVDFTHRLETGNRNTNQIVAMLLLEFINKKVKELEEKK